MLYKFYEQKLSQNYICLAVKFQNYCLRLNKNMNSFEKIQVGSLLCAEPFLLDIHFKRKVVFITNFSKKGISGFVINERLHVKLNDIMEFGFPDFDAVIFHGGPCENDRLYFIHSRPELFSKSYPIVGDLYLGGDMDELKKAIYRNKINSNEIRFFVGYSGWDFDQLRDEMKEKTWIVAPYQREYFFDTATAHLWKRILRDLGGNTEIVSQFDNDLYLN